MPYDSSKDELLREVLKALKDQKFGSTRIIEDMKSEKLIVEGELTRQDIDRFKEGDSLRSKSRELSILWQFLERHWNYGKTMRRVIGADEAERIGAQPNSPEQMASALRRFFSEAQEPDSHMDMESVRKRFAGRYEMIRPGWTKKRKTGFFMSSLVEVVDTENAASIKETQKQDDARFEKYDQIDSGFFFTFGGRIYFLMKEITPSATIKLAALDSYVSRGGSEPLDHFFGTLYVSSNNQVYPSVGFWCRRLDVAEIPPTKQFEISAIGDQDIINHLAASI